MGHPGATAIYPLLTQWLFAAMALFGLGPFGFKVLFTIADMALCVLLCRRFGAKSADWEPWLLSFLRSLKSQIGRLRERLEKAPAPPADSDLPGDLSPMAGRLLRLLEERKALSVGAAAEALAANRNTLKGKFAELTDKGYAELHGKGRGAHSRRTVRSVGMSEPLRAVQRRGPYLRRSCIRRFRMQANRENRRRRR